MTPCLEKRNKCRNGLESSCLSDKSKGKYAIPGRSAGGLVVVVVGGGTAVFACGVYLRLVAVLVCWLTRPSSSTLAPFLPPAFRNCWRSQPAVSSSSAAGSSSFRTARTNSSSRAAAHSMSPFDPVRTGPAASGVGSHAAAQAASEERRRLEQNGSGSSARRPVSSSGASVSPPSSEPGEGRHEQRPGPRATGTDGGGDGGGGGHGDEAPGEDEDHADAASRPAEPSRPAMKGKSSVSGDDVLAVSHGSGSKEPDGKEAGGTGVPGTVPKVQTGSPLTKGVVSSTDVNGGSVVRGSHTAAAGSGDSVEAREDRRDVDQEEQYPAHGASREEAGGSGVSGFSPPSSTGAPSTAQGSAVGAGGRHEAAAAAAAAPGPGNDIGENAAKVVRFATTEGKQDPAADGKPASPARPAEAIIGDDPPLRGGDLLDTASGTDVLFQPALPSNASPRLPSASSSAAAEASGGGNRVNGGAIEAAAVPAARGAGEEQGGFVGGGGGGGEGGEGLMSSSYLGDMDEDELAQESDRLKRESNRAQRDAETVTEEMKEEVRL